MKLKFEIEVESEERDSLQYYVQAMDMYLALSDISTYLREQCKYTDSPDDIEQIRKKFYQIIEGNGIDGLGF